MRELFSGRESLMTRAFKWCGWNTLAPVDKLISKEMDITNPALQEELLLQAG